MQNNELLLIHITNNKNIDPAEQQTYLDMLLEKDYEMLNAISENKDIQKKIQKDTSIIIVNQEEIH
jgi:succinate dehydrogenase flavin-adding protein (antitoxin of CptAB toxin-antitoxin module)